jgi:hypothetical protein
MPALPGAAAWSLEFFQNALLELYLTSAKIGALLWQP